MPAYVEALERCIVGGIPLEAGKRRRLVGASVIRVGVLVFQIDVRPGASALHAAPCSLGRERLRVLVRVILGYLAHGTTTEVILAEFPTLQETDVRAIIPFAAASASEDLPAPFPVPPEVKVA